MTRLLRRILRLGKREDIPPLDVGCVDPNNRKRNVNRLKLTGIFVLFLVGMAAIASLFLVFVGEDYSIDDGGWIALVEVFMGVGWGLLCLWIVSKAMD